MTKSNNDLERVEMALRSEAKKAELKNDLLSLVDKIIDLYMDHGSTRAKLREVSWVYFDFALEKFMDRMKDKSEAGATYKFSTYFSWYIKTSIETYLGISEEPLKGIPVRKERRST